MNLLKKITARPWEHAGELEGLHGEFIVTRTASRTGLAVFLAVLSSMFLLFMISYYTRSLFPDWEVLADPSVLWINTLVLVLASVALQFASNNARRNSDEKMRRWLIAGLVLTLIFVVGQFSAWNQLLNAGFYAWENPSVAFFYLFTGLHAIHLVGGMVFLGRLGVNMGQEGGRELARQRVSLCATYWHYLLLVWLALFTLLLRT